MFHCILLAATPLLGLPFNQAAWPGEVERRLAPDVKLLQGAGVATDGPGLLEFFRKKTPTHDQWRQIEELIQQLSSKKYKEREQATKQLIALGHVAVVPPTEGVQDAVISGVRRAQT